MTLIFDILDKKNHSHTRVTELQSVVPSFNVRPIVRKAIQIDTAYDLTQHYRHTKVSLSSSSAPVSDTHPSTHSRRSKAVEVGFKNLGLRFLET